MGRLIDADLLIERIKRNDDLPWNLDRVMQVAFESCVRHSPTAYDVDKVVERIQNITFRSASQKALIINIVKKGGIE